MTETPDIRQLRCKPDESVPFRDGSPIYDRQGNLIGHKGSGCIWCDVKLPHRMCVDEFEKLWRKEQEADNVNKTRGDLPGM